MRCLDLTLFCLVVACGVDSSAVDLGDGMTGDAEASAEGMPVGGQNPGDALVGSGVDTSGDSV